MAMFGDSGALTDAKTMLGSQVDILDQSAADFDKASDIIGGAFNKLQGFFVGVGAHVVNALQPLLDEFNKLDLAGIGQQFGDALSRAYQILKATIQELTAGDALSLIGDMLILAFKSSINVLWAGLWGAIRAAGQLIIESFKTAISVFSILTTVDYWKGLGNALISMAIAFSAMMMHGVAALLDEIRKIPGIGRAIGNGNKTVHAYATDLDKKADSYAEAAAANLEKPINDITARYAEAGHNIADAFKRGYNDTGDLMDTSGEKTRIGDAVARITARADANQKKDDAAMPEHKQDDKPKVIAPFEGPARGSPGALASAVNLIMGRSANELILDENKKQTIELQQINAGIKSLKPAAATPVSRPVDATPRFG